ncbi:MAG: ABC transporter ATP-binding protein, partial [Janthinobacterium lividum]
MAGLPAPESLPVAPPTTGSRPVVAGALQVSGLTWRPAGRDAATLDGLDLSFDHGERVLLVGASGSGKSTFLRALAGLLDETVGDLDGSVTLDGRDPQERPGAIGLLLQDPRDSVVAEHVGRDVAFGPENRALSRSEIQSRVPAALDAVVFPYGADRRTAALSGGEGARLALAGALALTPQVLLLDEPTAMLDTAAAAEVRDAVRGAADDAGLTLVVAEHQLGPWLEVCTRLVVLHRGRVLADGSLTDVLREQAEVLLTAGVWVPGASDPTPLPVPAAETVGRRRRGLRWTRVEVSGPDGRLLADGLDGQVDAGQGLAVVGRSGAGKSTLLRVLAGLARPTSGQVELGTTDGWRPVVDVARSSGELARHLGWASQHSEETFTARTVLAEVRATGEVLNAGDAGALTTSRARAELLIDALGLGHLREEDPYALSGGEQRRVVLAAALAHDPDVLLLDEPTVGQDRHTWAAVAGVLDAARRGGAGVVATTHDHRLAERLGSHLA